MTQEDRRLYTALSRGEVKVEGDRFRTRYGFRSMTRDEIDNTLRLREMTENRYE